MLEQGTSQTASDNLMTKTRGLVHHLTIEAEAKLFAMKPLMRLYEQLCDIQGLKETLPALAEYRQSGYGVVYDSTHTSHADGPFLSFPVRRLNRHLHLDGALIPAAASMRTGGQGDGMRAFFHAFDPRMRENGLFMLDSVRPKERRGGMTQSTIGNLKEVVRAPENNLAIAMFAEGSVQAGRTNPETGAPFGQIPPENETVQFYQLAFRHYKNKVVILPIAIIGTHLIFSPDTRSITPFARQELRKRLKFHHGLPPLVTIRIGTPYTAEDMVAEGVDLRDIDQVRRYLMYRKSLLLPEELQGEYKIQTDAT